MEEECLACPKCGNKESFVSNNDVGIFMVLGIWWVAFVLLFLELVRPVAVACRSIFLWDLLSGFGTIAIYVYYIICLLPFLTASGISICTTCDEMHWRSKTFRADSMIGRSFRACLWLRDLREIPRLRPAVMVTKWLMILWCAYWGTKIFLRDTFLTLLSALVLVLCVSYFAVLHNRFSVVKWIHVSGLLTAFKLCVKRFLLLLIIILPALALKAGIDWVCFRAIDEADARMAAQHGIVVPVPQLSEYPWYSPLQWLGIPRISAPYTSVNIEKEATTGRTGLFLLRSFIEAVEAITTLAVVGLVLRAMVSMLIRESIVQGFGLNFYAPIAQPKEESDDVTAPTSGVVNMHPRLVDETEVADKSWGSALFLRRDISPSGGTPFVEVPQPKSAWISRLLHHCYIMDRFDLHERPVLLKTSEGRRFVRWELNDSQIVVFSYAFIVGWTDSIKLRVLPSLQLGALGLGEILTHIAEGPGIILFEVNGSPTVLTQPNEDQFDVHRMVAFSVCSRFLMNVSPGDLNALLGVSTIKLSTQGCVLLDPKGNGSKKNNPISDVLRYVYPFIK